MPVTTIYRTILEDIRQDICREEIVFLAGPRQAGKATIMKITQDELLAGDNKALFLSLDYDSVYFVSQQS